MLADVALVAGRDLHIELRGRVATNQVLPFSFVVLVLFAFALDPDRGVLERATPGLFWVTVLLAAVLAVQRGAAIDAGTGVRDTLRLSHLEPAAVFVGKTAALLVQLLALELVLGIGVAVLYHPEMGGLPVVLLAALLATIGLAAAGTIHGAVAAGTAVRDTLLPLLLLPVVSPVLIGATRAFEAGFAGRASEAVPWCGLLGLFAALYVALGVLAYDSILEDS